MGRNTIERPSQTQQLPDLALALGIWGVEFGAQIPLQLCTKLAYGIRVCTHRYPFICLSVYLSVVPAYGSGLGGPQLHSSSSLQPENEDHPDSP